MAKVNWSAGIDSVSGALSKPGNNGQHACAKMLLGTHRVAPTQSKDCNRLYIRKKTERTSIPSNKELAARARFAKVQAAVRAILAGNSEQKAALVAEYKAQNKIGSLFGYAMKKLNGNYDQNGDLING